MGHNLKKYIYYKVGMGHVLVGRNLVETSTSQWKILSRALLPKSTFDIGYGIAELL